MPLAQCQRRGPTASLGNCLITRAPTQSYRRVHEATMLKPALLLLLASACVAAAPDFTAALAVLTDAIAARVFPGCAAGVLAASGEVLLAKGLGSQVYAGETAPLGGNAATSAASVAIIEPRVESSWNRRAKQTNATAYWNFPRGASLNRVDPLFVLESSSADRPLCWAAVAATSAIPAALVPSAASIAAATSAASVAIVEPRVECPCNR